MRRAFTFVAVTLLASALGAGSAQAANDDACGNGPHAIVGRLQNVSSGIAAHVGILPDSALGERYLNELRIILGARRSPGEALDLVVMRADFASTAGAALASMRRAPVATDGSFSCGGLAAGHYLAVAFVSQGAGAAHTGLDPSSMQIFAASATVGTHYDAAIIGWTNLGGTP